MNLNDSMLDRMVEEPARDHVKPLVEACREIYAEKPGADAPMNEEHFERAMAGPHVTHVAPLVETLRALRKAPKGKAKKKADDSETPAES